MLVTPLQLLAGAGLDLLIGDPQWMPHPVRAIGWWAVRAERLCRATGLPPLAAGVLFWLMVVTPVGVTVWLTLPWAAIYWIYALLACRDLDVESSRVIAALKANDVAEARRRLSWIVGRDTAHLDEPEIVRATVETVAENLNDGVIAPLFWLALTGPVGMAVYKAVNTLDSMVGYRDERYLEFGRAAARIDDVANFAPARITALLIWMAALLPGFSALRAIQVTLRDGASQPSPNSGYPEAAFAGALGVQLGGVNYYRGVPSLKAQLGDSVAPLNRGVFARARVLLYACEAGSLAILLGAMRWA